MNKVLSCFILLATVAMTGCNAFIEPSLKDETVQLISPPDNIVSQDYTQTFWWEKVEGASRYNLQIVSPSFDSVATLVADTNLSSNKFTASLVPGNYQWRVRAENNGTESAYVTRSFEVDSASLAGQQITINTPDNSRFYGQNLLLDWQLLFGASKYVIQIDTVFGGFNQSDLIFTDTLVPTEIPFFRNFGRTTGAFIWRVKAFNNVDATGFSDITDFVIDNTPPVITVPVEGVSPANVTLGWDPLPGASSFDVFVRKQKNGIKSNFPNFPKNVNTTTLSFTATVGDTLWWTVGARDVAGNLSDTLAPERIVITQK